MANKRVITSDIWQDDFFGPLPFFEQMLWIGLFSKCADDQGRMMDNPTIIRANVMPYKDIPIGDIEAALVMFEREGKILRYQIDGKRYIQIVNWWDHQQGQWAMPSKYPAPDGWRDRVRSHIKGVYIEENWPKRRPKQDGAPEEEEESPPGQSTWTPHVPGHNPNPNPNPDPDPDPLIKKISSSSSRRPEIFAIYEREIGPLTPIISESLKDIEKTYPLEWIVAAFEQAARQNKRSLSYALGTLRNWQTDGFKANNRPGGKSPPGKKEISELTPEERRQLYAGGEYADFVEH